MFLSFFRKKSVFKEKTPRNEGIHGITVNNDELRDIVFDLIRTIRDPEKPQTLEDLNVVYEDGVEVRSCPSDHVCVVRIEFNPTVPHCSLATLIGLCIRVKLERNVPYPFKLDIYIKEGAHTTEEEIRTVLNSYGIPEIIHSFHSYKFNYGILTSNYVLVNKQINDKERISAAMENPKLREMVENCIKEED